jgi:hypothetical protein
MRYYTVRFSEHRGHRKFATDSINDARWFVPLNCIRVSRPEGFLWNQEIQKKVIDRAIFMGLDFALPYVTGYIDTRNHWFQAERSPFERVVELLDWEGVIHEKETRPIA